MNAELAQLLISIGGIALMVGLCAALFGWREMPLDLDAALRRLALDVPGFRAGRTGRDARAALIENAADGSIHLVLVRGDGLIARKLPRDAGIARDGRRLSLALGEFTLERAELELTDAADWEARLKGTAA